MSYLVLARKYRPQTFEDVVGQSPVSRTLENALTSGRVAHGYIFSGPRGIGKTTTARILAKCLNCVDGPTVKPCNKCDACQTISLGTSTDDVLEIDGASNRGIEQIRELRDSAKYTPARSRYRIYIIDEAHQITKDAFGALLKTLEEPPSHVVFMMATTEVQKIPSPILSRCQRFSLRPISSQLVFKHLQDICKKEKITVEDSALADIVRFVEGSLRDALSLLDQALVYSPKGITDTTVRELLGLLPLDVIQNFAGIIDQGDPAAILQGVDHLVRNGLDLTQMGKDLQSYYHDLMLTKAGVEDAFKVNNPQAASRAKEIDFSTLERNIRLLARLLDDIRTSDTPRALFEIYALRLGQKSIDPRALLERLEQLGQPGSISSRPAGKPAQPNSYQAPIQPQMPRPSPQPINAPAAHQQPISNNKPASPEDVLAQWDQFVLEVAKEKMSLGSALDDAKISADNGKLTLTFGRTFNQTTVQRSMDILTPIMVRCFGQPVSFEFKVDTAPKPTQAVKPPSKAAMPSETPDSFVEMKPEEMDPEVQKTLKYFPGVAKKEKR